MYSSHMSGEFRVDASDSKNDHPNPSMMGVFLLASVDIHKKSGQAHNGYTTFRTCIPTIQTVDKGIIFGSC